MEASRVTRVSNIFSFTRGGCSKPSMPRSMALYDTTTNHIGCGGEPGMCRHGLGTQETERSSMSHMDDVIGMMAYLEQHTDGRVTPGRYGVLGSCNHLAKLRDVFLSGSFRINRN